MSRARALSVLLLFAALLLPAPAHSTSHEDIIYDVTGSILPRLLANTSRSRNGVWLGSLLAAAQLGNLDEEYYQMPQLFHLDEYEGCLATHGAYCLGSFELTAPEDHKLYRFMQRVTANWVDYFNHTRLHRGLCLPRSCRAVEPLAEPLVEPPAASFGTSVVEHTNQSRFERPPLETWFSSCVNESTWSEYNMSAQLYNLDYCESGRSTGDRPVTGSERAFAALLAALFALAAVSTVLDLTIPDHARKRCSWALAWSLPACWRALHATPGGGGGGGSSGGGARVPETDLRALDGLRVLCMMCVIIEHVCWLATQSYLVNPRHYELMRLATEVMMMVNSTLVVQIFFMMSSFLLAHKLLQQRRRGDSVPKFATFAETIFNRIIRVSPSYFLVVWFAASWWARAGSGPLWAPLVQAETDVCQRKWWTHLLYLNNILYADDKCLIQTWYLAADMQLYALSLALTLVLWRWRRGALFALAALLAGTITLLFALAYAWRLVPTYVMHCPELVRVAYRGESSFNVLYQSPLSNSPGALAGLLLAHLHHHLLDTGVNLSKYKVFRWVSVASPPLAVVWAALSPLLLGRGPPARAAAATLAAIERPMFSFFVALGLLGAMHDVKSPLRTLFSWRGWATPARLSFGVLLLHMPLNKSLVASRLVPSQITRQIAIFEWFGVALVSYLCALPLALLVELPAQRLYKALSTRRPIPARPVPQQEKTEMGS